MRIICEKGEFDLYPNFEATFFQTNVFLTNVGEQTQPITLPPSKNNLRLVGHSNRIDALYKPISDMRVSVSDGLFNRVCNMGIFSSDEEDGISCTLYFDSGDFYSRMNEVKLSALPWPVIQKEDGGSLEEKVKFLIGRLGVWYAFPLSLQFFVGTVLTNQNYKLRVTKNPQTSPSEVDVEGLFVLNGAERYKKPVYVPFGAETVPLSLLEGASTQKHIEGNNVINVGLGYGMTPFIGLSYILKTIFSNYGFSFDDSNIVDQVNKYKYICVLNNVADAIYSGVLKTKDLLPDVSIKEFLSETEKLLAGKFSFDEIRKEVSFFFFKKAFNENPDIDLTPFLSQKPKMLKPEFVDVIFSDLNSTIVDPDNSSEKNMPSETLEFSFLKEEHVSREFYVHGENPYGDDYLIYRPFDLRMVDVGRIVNKYSHVVVLGKEEAKKEKSGERKTIAFGLWKASVSSVNAGQKATQNTILPVFSETGKSDLEFEKFLYKEYAEFRENSNVPVEAEFDIPAAVLNQIDLQKPKVLQGQKVMIERIERKLGSFDTQKITFRTLRAYKDRP